MMLGEEGSSYEALATIQQALLIDPTNADLVAQSRELRTIEKEKQDEMRSNSIIVHINSSSSIATTSSMASVCSSNIDAGCVSANTTSKTVSKYVQIIDQLQSSLQAILQTLPSQINNTDSAAATTTVRDTTISSSDINTLSELALRLLTELGELPPIDNNNNTNNGDNDDMDNSTVMSVDNKLDSSRIISRVYLRTSGTLQSLINVLKQQLLMSTNTTIDKNGQQLVKLCVSILAKGVQQQRASKLLLIDNKVLTLLKSTILKDISTSLSNMKILKEVLQLFYVCCCDDISVKARNTVITDKSLLSLLGGVVGNISYNDTKVTSTTTAELSSDHHRHHIIQLCSHITAATAFAEHQLLQNQSISQTAAQLNSGALANLDEISSVTLIGGLATALHYILTVSKKRNKDANNAATPTSPSSTAVSVVVLADVVESIIKASLGLSQIEKMRSYFAISIPVSANAGSVSACLVGSIIAAIQAYPYLSSNGIAALMNACLEGNSSSSSNNNSNNTTTVRQAVLANGGLALALSDLHLTDDQRRTADGPLLSRKAGLLARIVATTATAADSLQIHQKHLLEPAIYRMICRRITIPGNNIATAAAVISSNKTTEKKEVQQQLHQWMYEERSHYIRVLASLTQPPVPCLAIGMEEDILAALLAIFPNPQQEGSDGITARSVTLMPAHLEPPLLLGNAARCLMPYADIPQYAAILYQNKELRGVEKFICAMASCPDMRVRKNIAILLAKGCRVGDGKVRSRITELRGMQMMIELQDKL